jgi:hypothetical protein
MEQKYEIGDLAENAAGQRYTLIGREPYERPDGTMSEVLHWRSACRVCKVEFECKSGPTAFGASVHCKAHKMTRQERTANWLASMRTPEARRKAAATMKATMKRRAEIRAEVRKLF